MAETGASPDAWAEVLLLSQDSSDTNHTLVLFQAWCRRAAEEAENRRIIEESEDWISSLVNLAKSTQKNHAQGVPNNSNFDQKQHDVTAWVESQLTRTPPPDRSPGWTVHVTFLDLVRHWFTEPHPCFAPTDWRDVIVDALRSKLALRSEKEAESRDWESGLDEVFKALDIDAEALRVDIAESLNQTPKKSP